MRNNIISLKNASHLSFIALALLEVNNLGIISSELLSSYSTTYLYPALAAGTIILGALNAYQSHNNFKKCLASFRDRYHANLNNYSKPIVEATEESYEDENGYKVTISGTMNLVLLSAIFVLTTASPVLRVGHFPLLCSTSMLHFNFNKHIGFADKLLKDNIPEEHLKLYNQDTFASRVLNKLSSTLGLNIA